MGKKRIKIKITKENYKFYIALAVIVIALHFVSEFISKNQPTDQDIAVGGIEQLNTEKEVMMVHFLDVEQGLCIIAQLGDEVLIYDGGERDTSSHIVDFFHALLS